jgi:hypothetical protein
MSASMPLNPTLTAENVKPTFDEIKSTFEPLVQDPSEEFLREYAGLPTEKRELIFDAVLSKAEPTQDDADFIRRMRALEANKFLVPSMARDVYPYIQNYELKELCTLPTGIERDLAILGLAQAAQIGKTMAGFRNLVEPFGTAENKDDLPLVRVYNQLARDLNETSDELQNEAQGKPRGIRSTIERVRQSSFLLKNSYYIADADLSGMEVNLADPIAESLGGKNIPPKPTSRPDVQIREWTINNMHISIRSSAKNAHISMDYAPRYHDKLLTGLSAEVTHVEDVVRQLNSIPDPDRTVYTLINERSGGLMANQMDCLRAVTALGMGPKIEVV